MPIEKVVMTGDYAPAVKVRCLRLMMHPPGAGKKRIYEGRGLKCRRKETGIYLVRRKDKRPLDNFPIQVRLLDPWSVETIDTISPKTEHTTKTEDGEDCERVSEVNFEIGEVPRWYVMVRVLDRFSVMVRLYELPELSKAQRKKAQHKYHAQLSDRAGFCLITHQLGEIDGKR